MPKNWCNSRKKLGIVQTPVGMNRKYQNIKLRRTTIQKIKKLGKMEESISSFIEKIVEHTDHCDRWWEDRFD